MPVIYVDDKKNKHQSHEAIVDVTSRIMANGHFNFYANSYGATKDEAKAHMLKLLTDMRNEIDAHILLVTPDLGKCELCNFDKVQMPWGPDCPDNNRHQIASDYPNV
jgi:hypothetical protein